jgi:hypothetical protein
VARRLRSKRRLKRRKPVMICHALPAPTTEDIHNVVRRAHAGLLAVLARHGRSLDGAEEDVFASEEPVLASCAGASAADLVLIGEHAGQRTSKLGRISSLPTRMVPMSSSRA